MTAPASTYRIQLSGRLPFSEVQRLVGYLDALGVTDCYLSPILAARAGSPHGYDISDHGTLNPELGDRDDLGRLAASLRARGLGLIVDFVPNHMGADPNTNEWWRDVLRNGPSSPYARYFDIDWRPAKSELRNKVLLPILGGPYGDVLERGELRLAFDAGALVLACFERTLPIEPKHSARGFALALDRLTSGIGSDRESIEFRDVVRALESMPDYIVREEAAATERQRIACDARERLSRLAVQNEPLRRSVQDAVRIFNGQPAEAASFDALHRLLDAQPYRLAYWRTALDEINYRRFCDINDLAGLRVEDPKVFAAAHALLLELVAEGTVTGIRIDHPDGLFDPTAYLQQLRQAVAAHEPEADPSDTYIVVEKILGRNERLRKTWPVQGTTGYNALSVLNGLFVHPEEPADLRPG